ncbi:cyclophilin-like fold protein [Anaerotignum sp.]|uniref:cyclophilin-like fold protein n=1 Tax=Anaerotignum sp. TaxID=2039241 RepID=UPI00289D732F|nr:cyclophilin-like fold protein [Anaerotignum sp.]
MGESLPTNDEQITTRLGDVILYQGNQLVIYYDTNSWSFTRLGIINNTDRLKEALGTGNVTITLSLQKQEA